MRWAQRFFGRKSRYVHRQPPGNSSAQFVSDPAGTGGSPHVEIRQLTDGLRQLSQQSALLKPGGHAPQVSLQ